MRAGLILCSALAALPLYAGTGLKDAASLYHRGRYDSALAVLDANRSIIVKRRDSLSLFQYSGMASARLGRGDEATANFRILLDLDSLFQFPRNEDSAILESFAKAQALRNGKAGEGAASGGGSGGGSGGALSMHANLPASEPVPTPAFPGSRLPGGESNPFGSGGEPARGQRGSGIGMALGAIPIGAGWLAEGRYKQGLALAFLQIGGTALSLYASSRITAEAKDLYGIQDERERGIVLKWQWTQGLALSTAMGSYLYSLIASRRP